MEQTHVSIKVYNLLGEEATLIDATQEVGNHEVVFNAKGLSSGTYIYQILTGKFNSVRKMLLLK